MGLKKRSLWYAFIHANCPHCHHGNMFINKNPYNLKNMSEMHLNCRVCGISFFPETGFYWGSMYMSYVITVFFSVINVVLIGVLSHWNLYALVIGNALLLAVGFPLFFRYARVIWLQINMPFNAEVSKKFDV